MLYPANIHNHLANYQLAYHLVIYFNEQVKTS